MNIPEYIVVVANSGRMLAQAAKKAGFKPLVIDLFADLDTQNYAEDVRLVPSLAIEHLIPAIDYFVNDYAVADMIYGSGLENHPESLFYLHSRLNILGNNPDTFMRLLNKQAFFEDLDRLGITYPEVSFFAPDRKDNWLIKPMQGQGGFGIKHYRHNDAAYSSVYWQKYQQGSPHSVLFLAKGHALQVIGFNTQWTVNINEIEAFIFLGIINCSELANEQMQLIGEWLNKLIPLYQLKGLNSLDFIQDGEASYVLEINPRPSASMQLYDGDLLSAHIKASQGLLVDDLPVQAGYTGYQIVYAGQDVLIPEGFEWPDGCMDLPLPGARIGAGQPICSMIAHQNQAQAVLKQLSDTQHIIINKLERFQTHALYR